MPDERGIYYVNNVPVKIIYYSKYIEVQTTTTCASMKLIIK